MKPPFSTVSGPVLGLILLVTGAPLVGACETFELDWTALEDSVTLYSLARSEFVDLPGAFDFYSRRVVVVEQPKVGEPADFDVAVSELEGDFVMLPAGVFATFDINPGIVRDTTGATFEELAKAPSEGYVTDAPVPIQVGEIYAIRTRQDRGGCSRYGKFEILALGPDGVVEFRQIRNRLCNDRELIPNSDD